MKDFCIAIQYTSGVYRFSVGSCSNATLLYSVLCLKTPFVGIGDYANSFLWVPVQFSVTLSTKDFPHHSVFSPFFLNVSQAFSEIIRRRSQHICLWCWAQTLFVNMQVRFLQEELARSTRLWEENLFCCDRNSLFFFLPSCRRCALLKSRECLHLKWRRSRPADYSMFLCAQLSRLESPSVKEQTGQAFGLLLLLLTSCSTRW